MPENTRHYNKPPLSHQNLLTRFQERGLKIDDEESASQYLNHISYFRLSGYGLFFEEFGENNERLHRFKEGVSFNNILQAYIIDRKIRVMAMDAIERIEVAIRSIINHEMSCNYNDSHWYLNKNLFQDSNQFKHNDFINQVKRFTAKTASVDSDQGKRQEQFIQHYYHQYDSPDYPPCWMVAEILPLGSWSKIYTHLKVSTDKKRISKKFNLSPKTLESWLHSLTYLRNLCAHHSRLYYRPLVIKPKKDKNMFFDPYNRFSNFASVIHWFLKHVSPNSKWIERLEELLNELSNDELICYGFQADWQDNDYWY